MGSLIYKKCVTEFEINHQGPDTQILVDQNIHYQIPKCQSSKNSFAYLSKKLQREGNMTNNLGTCYNFSIQLDVRYITKPLSMNKLYSALLTWINRRMLRWKQKMQMSDKISKENCYQYKCREKKGCQLTVLNSKPEKQLGKINVPFRRWRWKRRWSVSSTSGFGQTVKNHLMLHKINRITSINIYM